MVLSNEIRPRDIVWADPGYSDQKGSKGRPLLIISKSVFQQNTNYFICAGITTNIDKDPYLVPITNKDFEGNLLEESSQVMCKKIASIRVDQIKKKITRVTPEFYKKVIEKIKDDVLEL